MYQRVLFFIFLLSCSNDPKLVEEFITERELPLEETKEAVLVHTENGDIKVEVFANSIKRFKNQDKEVLLEGVIVKFYNDSLAIQSILKADYASIDEKNKIMKATNNVLLKNSDKKQLESEELIWDENKNKIYTDMDVKITTGNEVIFGEGFKSNLDFTAYTILKINGTVNF